MEVVIREAAEGDLDALSALASLTWSVAFGQTISPEDRAAHLSRHLARPRFEEAMRQDVILVALAAGEMVGFVQFGAARILQAPLSGDDQEIRRLYVLADHQDNGIGRRLMGEAMAHPRLARAGSVCLDVWEHNEGARRFYARLGFEVIGAQPFEVASGEAAGLDLIMARLSDAASASRRG